MYRVCKGFCCIYPDHEKQITELCNSIIDNMDTKYPFIRNITCLRNDFPLFIHSVYIPTRPDLMTYA